MLFFIASHHNHCPEEPVEEPLLFFGKQCRQHVGKADELEERDELPQVPEKRFTVTYSRRH